MIDTLLFDVDGTLLDFEKTERYALMHTFQKFSYSYDTQMLEYYSRINHALWESFESGRINKNVIFETRFVKLFREYGIEGDGQEFEKAYQNMLANTFFYLGDSLEIMKRLAEKFRLYIVTNGVAHTQRTKLSLSGIEHLVQDIFISEETGFQKPMKEFFDYCASRIPDYNRESTMIIGDSLTSDIKGGNNAGITACWFNPKGLQATGDVWADMEIRELKELEGILANQ